MRRFMQSMEGFSGRFAGKFGYELRDPFEDICEMLQEERAFSFSRFGDGEFNAVFGEEGANCDGHRYFPDLGRRLREILEDEPEYLMGLQPLAVMMHGAGQIQSVSGGIRWVLADSLHFALLGNRLDAFFDALSGREVLLVGPDHLRGLSKPKGWAHVSVPAENCWTDYEAVSERLRAATPGVDAVVLLCASMMSNVLVDDLYKADPARTHIDVGSVFDPYVGINSRIYHDELNLARPQAL